MQIQLLRAEKIRKSFSGIEVLKGVDLELVPGKALALVGENGAGKSTFMKIIGGIYPHKSYSGELFWKGQPLELSGPGDAQSMGIAFVHQELNLFSELTVGENIFFSHFPRLKSGLFKNRIDYTVLHQEADKLLKDLGVSFQSTTKVATLSTGEEQMVEIAKALSQKAELIIFDEPTSSLTHRETEKLFAMIDRLKARGVAIVYISHKLPEIYRLCETVAILRDGASVHSGELKNLSEKEMVEYMVGRKLDQLFPPKRIRAQGAQGEPLLSVKNWTAFKKTEGRYRVRDSSFDVYRGEILGIAGLMGAGRTDLLLGIFGQSNYHSTGELYVQGKKVLIKHPQDAIKAGLALVTEDRKKNGLHLQTSIGENFTLASLSEYSQHGLLDPKKQVTKIDELIKKLKVKLSSDKNVARPVSTLSGGNQQKIAIGKWLATHPKVLFLDEPTRGIDVGAKFEIYTLLGQLVDEGMGVVVVSSELPEIMGLCSRVVVMHEGKLMEPLMGAEIRETTIMEQALGGL